MIKKKKEKITPTSETTPYPRIHHSIPSFLSQNPTVPTMPSAIRHVNCSQTRRSIMLMQGKPAISHGRNKSARRKEN